MKKLQTQANVAAAEARFVDECSDDCIPMVLVSRLEPHPGSARSRRMIHLPRGVPDLYRHGFISPRDLEVLALEGWPQLDALM